MLETMLNAQPNLTELYTEPSYDDLKEALATYLNPAAFRLASKTWPSSLGSLAHAIPAASNASNFSSAVPFPPEMIAPACPIRLPGGAVAPATKPTIGFANEFNQ